MGLLRTFLAVELPPALQDAIQTATLGARSKLGSGLVRWVPGDSVHLTLKFLGDAAPSTVETIKHALTAGASRYEPFDVTVEGFGAYPNARRPRVLWVGLKAPLALASLQHDLDAATARLGFESEERGFSPHLTVGRVRQNASAADLQQIRSELEQLKVGLLGTLHVAAVHIYKSDLQPSGSVYAKLFTAPLGAA